MGIEIRKADLDADRQAMIEVLLRNRTRYSDEKLLHARYDWAYLKNPQGLATAWLAIDDRSGKTVGYTSAYPRKMHVAGDDHLAWNCADFSIDKAYRALGTALKLRRAAKTGVDSGEMPFLYAHPNDRMLVVHQKVGHHGIGQMKRFATLLRLDEKLKRIIPLRPVSAIVAAISNPALRLATPQPRHRTKPLRFEFVEEPAFGEEFTDLFEEAKHQYLVCGYRDASYLNWRYVQNPVYQLNVLKAFEGSRLTGYIIFGVKGGTARIVDLLTIRTDDELGESLLSGLYRQLRKMRVSSVSISLHTENPFLPLFQRMGFRERSDSVSTVISYAPQDSVLAGHVLDPKNWFMTVGDRDI